MESLQEAGPLDIVRVRGWRQMGWLRHGFSTRAGGVSTVYGGPRGTSLNLGWTSEDDAKAVRENRRRFVGQVRGHSESPAPGAKACDERWSLVGLRQVHSSRVHVIEAADQALEGRLESLEGRPVLSGDGMMTDVCGVMLGVGVADCVPVLVVDRRRRAVAAFHAGWRGTAARIVERGVEAMRLRYGSEPEDLLAAVGPSIGACCYVVGEELRTVFAGEFTYGDELFKRREISAGEGLDQTGLVLDLWEANRRQLVAAGLPECNVTVLAQCTACTLAGEERRYFSHRADRGTTGRMLGVIGVVKDGRAAGL